MDGNRQKNFRQREPTKRALQNPARKSYLLLVLWREAYGATGDHDRQEEMGNIQAEWETNLAKDKIIVYGKSPIATHPEEAHLDSTKNLISAFPVSNRNVVPRWLLW